MFIKANTKTVKGKAYKHYLLVESVKTPQGPRHNVICSLGNLKPAPKEYWLQLTRKVEAALAGQLPIESEPEVDDLVAKAKNAAGVSNEHDTTHGVTIDVDRVTNEKHREAGPVHVGHQMWLQLGMNEVLQQAGLDERACALTEILVLNRLAHPASERGTRPWIFRTALPDILGWQMPTVGKNALYRHLDKLHPQRQLIESVLAERERTLFNLDNSVVLYDLTSTYFEGQCSKNPQAKHGYSRDGRPDCKQIVVGLAVNRDGFSLAHEIFDGNRGDTTTLPDVLDALDKRVPGDKATGRTVMTDRGLSSIANLKLLAERGYHYVVAAKQKERDALLAQLNEDEGWSEAQGRSAKIRIKRVPADLVTAIKTAAVEKKAAKAVAAAEKVKNAPEAKDIELLKQKAEAASQEEAEARFMLGHKEQWMLCVSAGRTEKDKAIREKQELRLLKDLKALSKRVASGALKAKPKVHEAIGRLKERYPRVAKYYEISYDDKSATLQWQENQLRKLAAESLDGSYLLKTDRSDISDEEIWHCYTLLSRVEAAFRDLKSPLMERPIFHQLTHRVQTHVFICVLAYHLLVAIEKCYRDKGIAMSWETLREDLRTHQVCTVVLPTTAGSILRLRRASTPEDTHQQIYTTLGITSEVMRPVRTWSSD